MNTTREYVSMLMDSNQVNDEMLDRLLSEDAAAEAWYEYHLIGDCVRYKAGTGRDADFMQSAAFTATLAEISEEHKQRYEAEVAAALPVKDVQAANSSFFNYFAVAASVVAVAVAVWQFGPQVKGDSSGMVAEKAVDTKNQQKHIVPVAANPIVKNASDAVVLPDSVKNEKGVSQTTVRTEVQIQQDSSAVH
ncbi:sigma-E factor negative regulatory protein [Neisseria sicca]|uniref:sigma-E factor negative regulatory protein n=1 Tax=Neisseria sicca TaxID=490 RepID=UPI0002D8158A|nr:sigma-E factor negative regulatory protein [Neisseria sicca]